MVDHTVIIDINRPISVVMPQILQRLHNHGRECCFHKTIFASDHNRHFWHSRAENRLSIDTFYKNLHRFVSVNLLSGQPKNQPYKVFCVKNKLVLNFALRVRLQQRPNLKSASSPSENLSANFLETFQLCFYIYFLLQEVGWVAQKKNWGIWR